MTNSATELDGIDPNETIGHNVHDLLWRKHVNQKELAFRLQITPSVMSKKLRGTSSWSARQIAEAAEFLNVLPGRLFEKPTLG